MKIVRALVKQIGGELQIGPVRWAAERALQVAFLSAFPAAGARYAARIRRRRFGPGGQRQDVFEHDALAFLVNALDP